MFVGLHAVEYRFRQDLGFRRRNFNRIMDRAAHLHYTSAARSNTMRKLPLSVVVSVIALILARPLPAADTAAPAQPAKLTAQLVQTLAVFHRPESCTFSLDGQYLFVSNCGSSPRGLVEGAGAISKLAVGADGTLTMVNARLTQGLNGPLGITVLPRASARFPAGTLFVNVGMAWACDKDGQSIRDAQRLGTGVMAIDPNDGRVLAHLRMGPDTPMAGVLGHPVMGPNGAAFDAEGNLYVADGGGGGSLEPPQRGRSGIIRIPRAALDALAEGAAPAGVSFLPVDGTNGVGYSSRDDAIYFVGRGERGPGAGVIYRLPARSLEGASLPQPLASGLGSMDGIVITPRGSIIVSRMAGDLMVIPPGGSAVELAIDPPTKLVSPSDIKLLARPDGACFLAVPEQEMNAPEPWSQRVRVLRLPGEL
jgi:DNA-binding beta-propeller fold protein YncE